MKNKFILILIAVFSVLISCEKDKGIIASGIIITETRSLPTFSKIRVSDGFNVAINYGNTQSINVSTSDNIINDILTSVSNDALIISQAKVNIKNTGIMNIVITMPELNKLTAWDDVICNINGFENTPYFEVDISDDSKLTITGSTNQFIATVSDGSILDGFGFNAKKCNIKDFDDAKINIFCSDTLQAEIYDDSKLYYKGFPQIIVNTSDNGQLIDAN